MRYPNILGDFHPLQDITLWIEYYCKKFSIWDIENIKCISHTSGTHYLVTYHCFMMVDQFVKLLFDFSLLTSIKNCTLKNPSTPNEKLTLTRVSLIKKHMLIKAQSWLVFQTAQVDSRRAFFPHNNFRVYRSAAQAYFAPPQREPTHRKIQCTAKSAGNFHACTAT